MTTPTTSDGLREAVALLSGYNKWRRGEDDSAMPSGGPNPRLLGQAIDTVALLVPGLIAPHEIEVTSAMIDAALLAWYGTPYPTKSDNPVKDRIDMCLAILAALQAVKS